MGYKPEQFLSMFGGQRGWDRTGGAFEPKDDAVHIEDTNEQWEWWYFDFSFDNGYKAVATLHHHNMMMMPHIPTMQLFVYPPDGPPKAKYWALRPGQENSVSPDRCLVRMGDMLAEDTGNGYRLVMDMKELAIDVTITNLVPSWKCGSGVLWADQDSGAVTGWTVAVPRGNVKGTLRVEGEAMAVTGQGYHDHNYGTAEMDNPFWGWYWGRIFDPKYTLIYGWVIPKDPEMPVTSPFMLAKGNEIVLSTDQWTMTVEESQKDEQYGFDMPMRLRLTCDGPGVSLDGVLVTNRVVEVQKLPHGESDYYYYRFLADYSAAITVDGETEQVQGEILHELMIM